MMTPQPRPTERLVLRRWRQSDVEPFAALNADPSVMEHFPSRLSAPETEAMIARIEAHFEEHGFGLWAVALQGDGPLLGFVGLSYPGFDSHFTPAVEVGWRLAREHWGHGYAPEAALECLRFAFEEVDLDEVVSFTVPRNDRSRRVMEKIGLRRDAADDFEHPSLPEGHPLRPHVLYRLRAEEWRSARSQRSVDSG